jgi:hypothetical protein
MLSRSFIIVMVVLVIATVQLVTSDPEDDDYQGGTINGMNEPLDSVVSKRFSFRIPWKWPVYGGVGAARFSRFAKVSLSSETYLYLSFISDEQL